MRSNDVILGLPYDIFLFTMLQEILATTLNIELGCYHHVCGSLHLYDKNIELAKRINANAEGRDLEMPKMQSVSDIHSFLEAESAIRLGKPYNLKQISEYWRNLLFVIERHFHKADPTTSLVKQGYTQRHSKHKEAVR
jgi:thymidylate synthase